MAFNDKTLENLRKMHVLVKQGMPKIHAAEKAKTSDLSYRLAMKQGINLDRPEIQAAPKPKRRNKHTGSPLSSLIELPDAPKAQGLVGVVFCRPDQVASLIGAL